ncbi:hypothetical protein G4O51_08055 [Candidatus Bathyarchaeota archaeon A05DMB-2]|nr:hypothetical protein [Candidatus Bathyarchaeota archaeon A05DMB-2]
MTKDEKKLKIVVKKEIFIADLNDVKAVLNGWLDYTEIFEPLEIKQ